MEIRDLLEKMMKFAGEPEQKPGDQVRGSETANPTKSGKDHPFKGRLVGASENILKDLSKGATPKSKEQELAEEFQAFLEAEFKDTVDKRPGRKGARPARGHNPLPRYKTVKADESYMSEKDIELQDYRSMTNQEFQSAYGISKMEWINQNKALVIQNPDIKRALGLEEAVGQEYTVVIDRKGREKPVSGTMEELLGYFGYTLEVGKSYEHERGRYKINLAPKNVVQLVDALNKAKSNAAANGHSDTYYSVGQGQIAESHYKWEVTFKDGKQAIYHHNSPHYKDDTAASDIQYTLKSNPGATVKAYKDDKPFDWESILSEGWESGPEEYQEPHDDADDAYERQRQEKIDTEAEKEWAKLPKVSTYKLLGRGPNMEPNYEFDGKEYDTLEAAIEARGRLMADPETPHPEHIGIQTLTRVVDKTNEAITPPGSSIVKNIDDYIRRRDEIFKALADPKQRDNYPWYKQALFDLNRMAKQAGIKIEESRAHKQLATWFKNRELAQKYASGEVKIPTPQERQAQLKKLEKEKSIKEYGAANPPQKTSPAQAQQVAANLNIQKTALNQLKQINPEIDPAKAAAAMTKDTATMSPQEKDELAQVAKTVSPALGTPAFGSIKTAIQKSQVK